MYHSIVAVGHLGRDPEMRYTPSGQAVCNFSVAVNKQYTDKNGEKVKRTIWIRVSTWGKVAENCAAYLVKGSLVLVEGELNADEGGNPRAWTKQDGSTGTSFEITANNVKFLSKPDSPSNESNKDEISTEEVPF